MTKTAVLTRENLTKKQLAVLNDLCKLKKQIDPETAETIARLIASSVDLYVYGKGV